MALGIGANSAIFSVIDAVLLKPLPYPGGDRLMAVYESIPQRNFFRAAVAPGRLEEWNRLNRTFTALAGAYLENQADTSGPFPEKLVCAKVSPRFFSVLATPPLLGRTLNAEEEVFNGPLAAVISERLWSRRFGRDPRVLGQMLRFAGEAFPIVGVLPDSFRYPDDTADVWLRANLPPGVMRARDARFYRAIGRMREGVTMHAAQADLAAIQARLALEYPATDANWTAFLEPLKEGAVGGVRKSLWILYGAVSLVLLIACSNVACLLLAQASRRAREVAVRFSLGARRSQVIGALLLEAVCAALPGAAIGLLVAYWGAGWFRTAAAGLPRAAEIQLDWRIVLFTLSLTLATAILFGLFPAVHATRDATSGTLAQVSRTQVGGRQRLLRGLVSVQIALALVLLVGAGLLIRTLSRLGQVSLGFRYDNVLTLHVSASFDEKRDMLRVSQRLGRTLDALAGIPGVEAAAVSVTLPGTGVEYPYTFRIAGRDTAADGRSIEADTQSVSPDYFRALSIPLLAGEPCRLRADPRTAPAAMVNRTFVDQFLNGTNPIGVRLRANLDYEIAGVVGDIHDHGYARDPRPVVYLCELPGFFPDPGYLLRTAGNPAPLVEAVRRRMQAIEPNRAVYATKPLADYLDASLDEKRFQTLLLSLFGFTALALASVGLYGVTSFMVSARRREIGLRAALGARPSQILGHVFRQGASMASAGLAAGVVAALVFTRSMASLLFGVPAVDPVTFGAVGLLLASVAAAAIWIPARRATRVDPMEALREE